MRSISTCHIICECSTFRRTYLYSKTGQTNQEVSALKFQYYITDRLPNPPLLPLSSFISNARVLAKVGVLFGPWLFISSTLTMSCKFLDPTRRFPWSGVRCAVMLVCCGSVGSLLFFGALRQRNFRILGISDCLQPFSRITLF